MRINIKEHELFLVVCLIDLSSLDRDLDLAHSLVCKQLSVYFDHVEIYICVFLKGFRFNYMAEWTPWPNAPERMTPVSSRKRPR